MKKGGIGGYLTKTGLRFEKIVDFNKDFGKKDEFIIEGNKIIKNSIPVAELFSKNDLYIFLRDEGVNYKEIVSKKLLPDIAVLVYKTNTFFIFEVKYQEVAGSTDEKLQTCHFKISQYKKLLEKPLGYKVKYVYVLNDWFKEPRYSDVLEYIRGIVDCDYLFNKVPSSYIGI